MKVCQHTVAPSGYVDWHMWAEQMTRDGYRQHKCPSCGLWAVWAKRKAGEKP